MLASELSFLFSPYFREQRCWGKIKGPSREKYGRIKKPIEGATVRLPETPLGAITQANGSFEITGVPEGTYDIQVIFGDRELLLSQQQINGGDTLWLEIELEPRLYRMNSVVVSANRVETSREESPVIVTVSDEHIFSATQALSLSEGLSFQPGLRLETNCQNCGFTSLRMNGLGGAYTQILIDSRPIFSALNGVYGLDQIPVSMIDRVEVVRGGGSSLFGANAIAGTVNVITKDPIENTYEFSSTRSWIGGKIPDQTLSLNSSWVTPDLDGGITVFGLHRNRNPWDANGDGFSEVVKLNNTSVGLKGFYKPGQYSRLGAELHRIEEFRRGGNQFDRLPHQTDITEQLEHIVWGGQLNYELFSPDLKHKWALYGAAQFTDRDSYYGGGGNDPDPKVRAQAEQFYGITTDQSLVGGMQYTYDWQSLAAGATLSVGTEWSHNEVADHMPGYDRLIDQQVQTFGTYGQLQLNWNERITTLIGGRWDHTSIEGAYHFGETVPLQSDRILSVFNPRLNVMYDLKDNLQARLSYASGFRAPQAFDEDLHLETLGGVAQFIRLSDDLQAETSHSFTGSLNWRKASGRAEFEGLIEGFYTHLQNPFVNEFTGQTLPASGVSVMEKRNGEGAIVAGVNLEFNALYGDSFRLNLGTTVQQAQYVHPEHVLTNPETGLDFFSQRLLRTPNVYGNFVFSWMPCYRPATGYIRCIYRLHAGTQRTYHRHT